MNRHALEWNAVVGSWGDGHGLLLGDDSTLDTSSSRLHVVGTHGLALPAADLLVSLRSDWAVGLLRDVLLVVVDALHVVEQIISAWEATARDAAFTAFVPAQVGTIAMAVHAVGLALVTEEASSGRELLLRAYLQFTAEGLDVRVDEFAVGRRLYVSGQIMH